MRRVVDTLMIVMLLGILGGVASHQYQRHQERELARQTSQALMEMHRQMMFQAALQQYEVGQRQFPEQIERHWFDEEPPTNPWAGPEHPWLDLAEPGSEAMHPPDPVLHSPEQAGMWYNPSRGVFRARVPEQANRKTTLSLYNRINGLSLDSLADEK